MYEDYLEEFVFKTAKAIARKLFGSKSNDGSVANESRPLLASTSSAAEDITEEPTRSTDGEKAVTEENDSDRAQANPSRNESSTECVKRIAAKKTKSSLDAKDDKDDDSNENKALVKCNTYDALCHELSDEIAEAEKRDEESNRVATQEGNLCG